MPAHERQAGSVGERLSSIHWLAKSPVLLRSSLRPAKAGLITVRAATGSKLFTTEVARTVPTITRLHIDFCMVIKHDEFLKM